MQGAGFVQYVVRPHGGVFELSSDGRNDHRGGASAKAAPLQDQHRPLAALFAAYDIAKGGAVDFAALNTFHVVVTSCRVGCGPGAGPLRLERYANAFAIESAPRPTCIKEEPSNGQ